MKGIILLASGFEDTEAITTIDILRRAGLEVDMCACNNEESLLTQSGLNIKPELLVKNISFANYDFLIIPGGKAVFNTLINLDVVDKAIQYFNKENKLIACICAAPMLLGKNGLLKNKEYTCFPSCEEGIEGIYTKKGVVVSENLITSKSMAYTIDFALEIVNYLLGNEAREKVYKSIFGM